MVVEFLHSDFGMKEEEIARLVSEAAYDYFDKLREPPSGRGGIDLDPGIGPA